MLSSNELGVVQQLYIFAMTGKHPTIELQAQVERLIQKQLVAREAAFNKDYDLPTWYRTVNKLKETKA